MSRRHTKTKAWKNSALPMLYHGLEDLCEKDRSAESICEMEGHARETFVQLGRHEMHDTMSLRKSKET